MKKRILNKCLTIVKNSNPDINDEKLDEIRYGLEGFYLTIPKIIFITLLSIILGIFKETMIMMIVFNILRTTGFGLHATKSWQCWVSSTFFFIILPLLSKYLIIPNVTKLVLGIISIILIFFFTPADTKKHPLINKKKREIWKFITTIECITFVILLLFTKDNTLSNLMLFGIYTEVILTNPFTYRLFNLQYNNYLNYVLNSNV